MCAVPSPTLLYSVVSASSTVGVKGLGTESTWCRLNRSANTKVVPAAPEPHADAAPGPRQVRAEEHFGFKVAPIFRGGTCVGWGATCGRHHNESDRPGTQCKKALSFGEVAIPEAEARLRVLQWCALGLTIPNGPRARAEHLAINARTLAVWSEEEIDTALREHM